MKRTNGRWRSGLMLLALLAAPVASAADARAPGSAADPRAASATVRFAVGPMPVDPRYAFSEELLALVLAKTPGPALVRRLGGFDEPATITALANGHVDVAILPMGVDDRRVLAVRSPLRRGLLGVRLLVTTPARSAALSRIESIDVLHLGHALAYQTVWRDRAALQDLGFRIVEAPGYRAVFDLVRGGQADYASRGISEVYAELADPRLAAGLVVVPEVALAYPLDDYFYVAAGNGLLAERLRRGLARAHRDGDYAGLFRKHFGTALEQADMGGRRILHVVGYPVPAGTPLDEFDVLELVSSSAFFDPNAGAPSQP